jgi:hypothetical protein
VRTAALVSILAALAGGCATTPADTAARSLCSLTVFSVETVKGTANGAAAGFVAAARAGNCSDPEVCASVAAITTTTGAVVGTAVGLGSGITCARECWKNGDVPQLIKWGTSPFTWGACR